MLTAGGSFNSMSDLTGLCGKRPHGMFADERDREPRQNMKIGLIMEI